VPYDYPMLPLDFPHLKEAADVLATFYKEFGVRGGGAGTLFGLRIDHVLHAAVGTPLGEWRMSYSPRRTVATLEQPLVLFCEVVYNDVLLPLCDTVVVLKDAWNYVDEKVAGIVTQIIVTGIQHYDLCSKNNHLKECLLVLHQIYEMMQQCEKDQTISSHLTDVEYGPRLKEKLRGELKAKMADTLWRLSNELLEMLLDIEDGDANDGRVAHDKHVTTNLSEVARLQVIAHNNHIAAYQQDKGCVIS